MVKRTEKEKQEFKNQLVRNIKEIVNLEGKVSTKMRELSILFATYNWTEINGKYEGNEYWSIEAFKNFAGNTKNRAYALVHEHVVPKNVIVKKIMKLYENGTFEENNIRDILDKYLIAAVITKDEDKNLGKKQRADMPPEFDNEGELKDNPWSRYLVHNKNNPENIIGIAKIEWDENKKFIRFVEPVSDELKDLVLLSINLNELEEIYKKRINQ
jgi:hypothetical protein